MPLNQTLWIDILLLLFWGRMAKWIKWIFFLAKWIKAL